MKKFIIVIGFFAVVIIVCAVSLQKIRTTQLKIEPTPTTAPSVVVTNEPSENPATWNVYHDEEGKFSIKYPAPWKAVRYDENYPASYLLNEKYVIDESVFNPNGAIYFSYSEKIDGSSSIKTDEYVPDFNRIVNTISFDK